MLIQVDRCSHLLGSVLAPYFVCALLCFLSGFAIVLVGKRELVDGSFIMFVFLVFCDWYCIRTQCFINLLAIFRVLSLLNQPVKIQDLA